MNFKKWEYSIKIKLLNTIRRYVACIGKIRIAKLLSFFYRNAKRDFAEYIPRIITKCSTSSRIFRDTRFQIGVRSLSAHTHVRTHIYVYTWRAGLRSLRMRQRNTMRCDATRCPYNLHAAAFIALQTTIFIWLFRSAKWILSDAPFFRSLFRLSSRVSLLSPVENLICSLLLEYAQVDLVHSRKKKEKRTWIAVAQFRRKNAESGKIFFIAII